MAPQPPPSRAKLQPTVRAPERFNGTGDDRQITQAGRSPTNLSAHASSQTIREAQRPASREMTSSPSVLRKKNKRPVTPMFTSVSELPPPTRSAPTSPYTPPLASPLNPTTSKSSSGSSGSDLERKTSDSSGGESSTKVAERPSERPLSPGAAVMPIAGAVEPLLSAPQSPLMRPPRRPIEMSQRNSSVSLSRLSTPRTVRDLGSDYTRYPDPFGTRNNSLQDLSTPLPRYNSATHLLTSSTDLSNRLSNPFKDEKRASNAIESAQPSAPGTPNLLASGQQTEKTPVATTKAVPTRSGTPAFINEADPEKTPFYPYMDDRLGAPYAFPLYTDQKEDDDDMHMPMWDDDKKFKPKLSDRFSRRNIVNTCGMIFLLVGLLCVFIALPIISYTGTSLIPYTYDTPMSQMGNNAPVEPWAQVNDNTYPLLQNLRTGLIDPDTPKSAKTRQSRTGDDLVLVFSDEFNAKNRTFYPGDDPFWFAPDIWYGATQDLEWYDPDAVNTGGGTLQIQLDQFPNHGLDYRSGMLNSWNHLCFKGGVFEVSMSLPGPAGVHGLWPGVWTMGNLGRPGYLATTDGMWPYTYNSCDAGITPNQSMTDGTSNLPGQRLTSCSCAGEDHPTPGTGRGAPEIDIAEVSGDWGNQGLGVATQSFQVAPFDIWYYPNYEFMETPNYNLSFVNTYTGGPYQQAVSTTSMLNNNWYDGKQYQKYAFEYTPGGDKNAGITWWIGDEEMMRFDGRAIGPNGNVGQRLVSEEPMSMILNLGFSHSWVDIDLAALKFPTVLQVDYVRIYQDPDSQIVTCDPPGFETTDYIAKHPAAYNNPNFTHWSDAGYTWPKNTIMAGCSA